MPHYVKHIVASVYNVNLVCYVRTKVINYDDDYDNNNNNILKKSYFLFMLINRYTSYFMYVV